jgi:hypothetical protein
MRRHLPPHLMTTTAQPRHVKLASRAATRTGSCGYELKQMTDAFDHLSLQWS